MSDIRQLPSSPNYPETADCLQMKAVGRPKTLFLSVPRWPRNSPLERQPVPFCYSLSRRFNCSASMRALIEKPAAEKRSDD